MGSQAMAKLGLQLYTVRDEVEKDLLNVLRQVGRMGYDGVEFAGGFKPTVPLDVIKAVLDEAGLETAGVMAMYEELKDGFAGILDLCEATAAQAVVFPWIPESLRSAEGYRAVAGECNAWGRRFREAGLPFLYHVHGYEFAPLGGQTGMDILMEAFDPQAVNLEPDVYWVEVGGVDAAAFVRRYAARSPYIHFKDMKDKVTHEDAEVGDGVLDMKTIAEIGYAHRAKWFIVEQEQFTRPTLESAQISCRNLRRIMQEVTA